MFIKKKRKHKKNIILDKANIKIIIRIHFNTFTKPPFSRNCLSKEWIEKRLRVFNKFTLQSLKLQTNQNFTALIIYNDKSKDIIERELKKYDKLPKNIIFVSESNYNDKITKCIKNYDYLYLVRLDSDDMYHKSFIQKLYDYKPKKGTIALINQDGYIYDSINKRLKKYHHYSPPFYTLIYKVKDYIKKGDYNIPGGHPNVIKLPHETINGNNFMVTIHSKNTSTKFRHKDEKIIYEKDSSYKNILKDFIYI